MEIINNKNCKNPGFREKSSNLRSRESGIGSRGGSSELSNSRTQPKSSKY